MASPHDVMMALKRRQARKRKTVDETNDREWKPMPKVTLEVTDAFKTVYTREENFRAYKLFSMMDVDNGGSISLRELNRVLLGDINRTFSANFEHPDTGISWTTDVDNYIILDVKEPASPSHIVPYLIKGLRLVRVNEYSCGTHPGNLHAFLEYYIKLHDEPVELEFLEPEIILNQFSYVLDIQVESLLFSVELPQGAIYNLDAFRITMKELLVKAHGSFKFLQVGLIKKSKQLFFKSKHFKFRLMFGSGPNIQKSCRFALGFSADDYPPSNYIIAQPMAIDLNLGISRKELEVLLKELFERFDTDGSGEFEFEEFRDFYIKFLDTEESIEKLRQYAHYRFRDLELEAYWYGERDRREKQRILRERTKLLAGPIQKQQRIKFYENSEVGKDGIRRRIYAVRPENKTMLRKVIKNAASTSNLATTEAKEDLRPAENLANDDHMPSEVFPLQESVEVDPLIIRKKQEKQARKEARDKEREIKKQERHKQIIAQQKFNRINKYNLAAAAVVANTKADKKKARMENEMEVKENMIDVQEVIRLGSQRALSMTSGVHGHFNLDFNLSNLIFTPALKLNSSLFGTKIKASDIELDNLPPTILHPATLRYFMIKDTVKPPDFDSSIKHPAFFTSEYFRKSTRHSSIAIDNAMHIKLLWDEGAQYRQFYNIKRDLKVAPDDIPPRKNRVTFVLPTDADVAAASSRRQASKALLGRATLVSIALIDINMQATLLDPNSPFVSITCGDFKGSTEINVLGGGNFEWDELNWIMRVHANTDFQARVFSGTAAKNRLIASYTIGGSELAEHQVSRDRKMELYGELCDPVDGIHKGNIRISFLWEAGEEWDWFVSDYQQKENEKKKHAKLMKYMAGQPKYYPKTISFPLKLDVVSITVYDLRSVHMIRQNSPRVFVECGSWMQTSPVKHNAGMQCQWDDLNWLFGIVSDRANLIFIVYSGDATVGRFAISGYEVSKQPFSPSGDMDLRGELVYNGDSHGGKINVKLRIHFDEIDRQDHTDESSSQANELASQVIVPPSKNEIARIKPLGLKGNEMIRSLLPARMKIAKVGVYDLPNAHTITRNAPYLKIRCGRKEINTHVYEDRDDKSKGVHAEWNDISSTEFPFTERMNLDVHVISRGKVIGSYSISAIDAMNHYASQVQQQSGLLELVDYISNNGAILEHGLIKLKLLIDSHGNKDLIDHILAKDIENNSGFEDGSSSKPLLKGYAEMSSSVTTSPNKKGHKAYESSPFKFTYLPEMPFGSRPVGYPFRMNIISFTATDLRPMHVMFPNSPHINAACGAWAMKTDVSKSTGSVAQFVALDWGFFVQEGSNLRCTVWSGEKCIGSCMVSAASILSSPVDNMGSSEFSMTLTYDSSLRTKDKTSLTAGKLLVKFILESKDQKVIEDQMVPEFKADIGETEDTGRGRSGSNGGGYIPISIKLQPPILVTIYTVAAMDLICGHRFRKNSPMIKTTCGKFLRNTSVIEAGGDSGKWEELLWSVYMSASMKLKLVVLSGSVVLGSLSVLATDLIKRPVDKFGLTEFEGYLLRNNEAASGHKGRVRIVCRLEAHFQEDESDDDTTSVISRKSQKPGRTSESSSDDELAIDLSAAPRRAQERSLGKRFEVVKVPKVSKVTIEAVAVSELKSVHTISLNSPYVRLECGLTVFDTNAQFLGGSSAQWLNLSNLSFSMKRKTQFRITCASGSKLIGAVAISIEEIYKVVKDDNNHRLVVRELTKDGDGTGTLKIKLSVEDENQGMKEGEGLYQDEVDEDGFEISDQWNRAVEKSMPPEYVNTILANDLLKYPFSLTCYRMTVMDVANFHSHKANSLSICMHYGDIFKKTSDPLKNSGRFAQWNDCQNWSFVVSNDSGSIRISVLSDDTLGGTLVLPIRSLISMPRNRNSQVDIVGHFVRQSDAKSIFEPVSTVGRVHIIARLANYVAPEMKAQVLEERNKLVIKSLRDPDILGYITINKIMVWELLQVYGLFKNSPKVVVSIENWTAETAIAVDAGGQAAWPNLRWVNVPLFEGKHMVIRVYSGNEVLGEISLAAVDILNLIPRRRDDNTFAIASAIYDGSMLKGNVCLFAVDQEYYDESYFPDSLSDIEDDAHGNDDFPSTIIESLDEQDSFQLAAGQSSYLSVDSRSKLSNSSYSVFQQEDLNELYRVIDFGISTSNRSDTAGPSTFNTVVTSIDPGETSIVNASSSQFGTIITSTDAPTINHQNSLLSSEDGYASDARETTVLSRRKSESSVTLVGSSGVEASGFKTNRSAGDNDTRSLSSFFTNLPPIETLQGSQDVEPTMVIGKQIKSSPSKSMNRSATQIFEDFHPLSLSTPTPLHSRVSIQNIELRDLKSMHMMQNNSPYVKLLCGDWSVKTDPAVNAGANARWSLETDLGWSFSMKKMTFMKLEIYSGNSLKGKEIGSVVISTRDILEVKASVKGGFVDLIRVIEKDAEPCGKLQISLRIETLDYSISGQNEEQYDDQDNELRLPDSVSQPSIAIGAGFSHTMSSSAKFSDGIGRPNNGSNKSSNLAISLDFPITLQIISISALDLLPHHVLLPNSPYFIIECGHYRKKGSPMRAAGANALWNFLEPTTLIIFPVFDGSSSLFITILSGSSSIGSYSITMRDVLNIPRNQQGYTNVSANLYNRNGKVVGKVSLSILLSPYITPEMKARMVEKANLLLMEELANRHALIGSLDLMLGTALDISAIYRMMTVTVKVGDHWQATSRDTMNRNGTGMWPQLQWNTIPVYERNDICLEVRAADEVIGMLTINAFELSNLPRDTDNQIIIEGDIISGLTCKGSVNFIGRFIPPLVDQSSHIFPSLVDVEDNSTVGTIIQDTSTVYPHMEIFDRSQVFFTSFHATDLRSVHSMGKNSPLVKLESDRWKKQTSSLPNAGKKGSWSDLNWCMPLMKMSTVRVTVTSGSVQIGKSSLSVAGLGSIEIDSFGAATIILELVSDKDRQVSGKLAIGIKFALMHSSIDPPDGSRPSGSLNENSSSFGTSDQLSPSPTWTPKLPHSNNALEDKLYTSVSTNIPDSRSVVDFNNSSVEPRIDGASSHDSILVVPITDTVAERVPDALIEQLDESMSTVSKGKAAIENYPELKLQLQGVTIGNGGTRLSGLSTASNNKRGSDPYSFRSSASTSLRSLPSSRPHTSRGENNPDDFTTNRSDWRSDPSTSSRPSYRSESSWNSSRSSYSSRSQYSESDWGSETDVEDDRLSMGSARSEVYTSRSQSLDRSRSSRQMITASSIPEDTLGNDDDDNVADLQSNASSSGDEGSPVKQRSIANQRRATITFDLCCLQWHSFQTHQLTHSRHAMARHVAIEMVRRLLFQVSSSFLAMSSGEDFLQSSFSNIKLRDNFDSHLFYIGCLGSTEEIIHEVALIHTKQIIASAYSRSFEVLFQDRSSLDLNELKLLHPNYFKRRKGIFMIDVKDLEKLQVPESMQALANRYEREDPNEGLVFGQIRGLPDIPLKAKLTIHDLFGFDISFIDPQVFPKRPYMTACKPYHNWAAETPPAWRSLDNLTKKNMTLSWYDLSGRYQWETMIIRIGQMLIFDLHDQGSGLIFGKMKLNYETIVRAPRDDKNVAVIYVEFHIANEFGGGKTGGVIRIHVDLSINRYVRPPKSTEYWDKLRIHHWRTYPLTPTATGVVRQKYLDIATQYDKQMIVHPVFYGFKIRWTGHRSDESRFTHPVFTGFSLDVKPLNEKAKKELELKLQVRADPNPYKYDPMAKIEGRCPVCGDGLDGCPRCFMVPSKKNGELVTLDSFAYDPIKEKRKKMEERRRQLAEIKDQEKAQRLEAQALAIGKAGTPSRAIVPSFDHGDNDSKSGISSADDMSEMFAEWADEIESEENKLPELHTNLTTLKGIRLFRNFGATLVNVYVKVMPVGYIRRIIVEPHYSVFTLYNMIQSHIDIGNTKSPMIILPTNMGYFEMTNRITFEDEGNLADFSGRATLSRFNLTAHLSSVCLIYIANYVPPLVNIGNLIQGFFDRNNTYNVPKDLRTYSTVQQIPLKLPKDLLQQAILSPISRVYKLQQKESRDRYKDMGRNYWASFEAQKEIFLKAKKERKLQEDRDRKAAERRIESQLKGLEGEEREIMKAKLQERDLANRNGNAGFSDVEQKSLIDKEMKYLERRKKLEAKRLGKIADITPRITTSDSIDKNNDNDDVVASEEESSSESGSESETDESEEGSQMQSMDDNSSDAGSSEWETASESSEYSEKSNDDDEESMASSSRSTKSGSQSDTIIEDDVEILSMVSNITDQKINRKLNTSTMANTVQFPIDEENLSQFESLESMSYNDEYEYSLSSANDNSQSRSASASGSTSGSLSSHSRGFYTADSVSTSGACLESDTSGSTMINTPMNSNRSEQSESASRSLVDSISGSSVSTSTSVSLAGSYDASSISGHFPVYDKSYAASSVSSKPNSSRVSVRSCGLDDSDTDSLQSSFTPQSLESRSNRASNQLSSIIPIGNNVASRKMNTLKGSHQQFSADEISLFSNRSYGKQSLESMESSTVSSSSIVSTTSRDSDLSSQLFRPSSKLQRITASGDESTSRGVSSETSYTLRYSAKPAGSISSRRSLSQIDSSSASESQPWSARSGLSTVATGNYSASSVSINNLSTLPSGSQFSPVLEQPSYQQFSRTVNSRSSNGLPSRVPDDESISLDSWGSQIRSLDSFVPPLGSISRGSSYNSGGHNSSRSNESLRSSCFGSESDYTESPYNTYRSYSSQESARSDDSQSSLRSSDSMRYSRQSSRYTNSNPSPRSSNEDDWDANDALVENSLSSLSSVARPLVKSGSSSSMSRKMSSSTRSHASSSKGVDSHRIPPLIIGDDSQDEMVSFSSSELSIRRRSSRHTSILPSLPQKDNAP